MNDTDALVEAAARWGGGRGLIQHERLTLVDGSHVDVFSVGTIAHDAYAWSCLGRGTSWRAAFDEAEQHEAGAPAP